MVYSAVVKDQGGINTTTPGPIQYNSRTRMFTFGGKLDDIGLYKVTLTAQDRLVSHVKKKFEMTVLILSAA